MITFRLADALPQAALTQVAQSFPADRARHIHALLDAGYGDCLLTNQGVARSVEETFLRFDGELYRLLAWVVMPNHVHVLIQTGIHSTLGQIAHSWKSFTSHAANRLLGRTGEFWQREYFDRAIRDERHLRSAIEYIHNNPSKAGLVRHPQDWPFSSARR